MKNDYSSSEKRLLLGMNAPHKGMRKNMKKLLLFAVLFSLSAVKAMGAGEANVFSGIQVFLADEQTATFLFADKPVITFDEKAVVIKTSTDKVTYQPDVFKKYIFVKAEDTGINDVTGDKLVVELLSEGVSLKGLQPNSMVSVYDAGGRKVASAMASESGTAHVSSALLGKGIFIVKTNKQSFKFAK